MSFVPYRRGGMGQSNINPTTIWTPQTGFLNTPGTLTGGYQNQPQVTSVYDVPGLLLPAPDCTQASGGAFVSSECVDQALAVQQQNFARTAAYNAGTLKLPAVPVPTPQAPPPSGPIPCVQPNIFKNGICVDPFTLKPITGAMTQAQQNPNYVPPTSASHETVRTGTTTPPTTPPTSGDGSTTNYIAPETSFFEEDIPGTGFPLWGVAAAGLALFLLMGGRH